MEEITPEVERLIHLNAMVETTTHFLRDTSLAMVGQRPHGRSALGTARGLRDLAVALVQQCERLESFEQVQREKIKTS